MRTLIAVLLTLACVFSAGIHAADSDPKPVAGAELSLELYQKIKAHFDVLYGASSTMLIDSKQPNKAETEKALRADAAQNKDALLRALHAKEALHRELAARALEYCGDKKGAVEALSDVLNSDTDESVRRSIAGTLAKLPDARSVDALIKGLTDSAESVRGICCSALGNIKDTRATDPLIQVLKNESKPMVRLLSALALSKLKDPASLDKLKEALDAEKDERVKMAIAGAMRQLLKDSEKDKDKKGNGRRQRPQRRRSRKRTGAARQGHEGNRREAAGRPPRSGGAGPGHQRREQALHPD